MTRTHLGEMLAIYRASRRWSVRDLAERIGTSAATVSRIERGGTTDVETLLKLWTWLIAAVDGPEQPALAGASAVPEPGGAS